MPLCVALTVYGGGGKRYCPTQTRYALVGPPTNFSMEKRAVKLGRGVGWESEKCADRQTYLFFWLFHAVLLTICLAGFTNNQAGLSEKQVDTGLLLEERVCPDYEMLEKEDGWIYFTNVTTGDDLMRFRIKDKATTFGDFDIVTFSVIEME